MSETPAEYVIKLTEPVTLAEWERRLLEKARQLRATQKSATLQVQFAGPAMLLYVLIPAGRVE